jgi:hypothetical protein
MCSWWLFTYTSEHWSGSRHPVRIFFAGRCRLTARQRPPGGVRREIAGRELVGSLGDEEPGGLSGHRVMWNVFSPCRG